MSQRFRVARSAQQCGPRPDKRTYAPKTVATVCLAAVAFGASLAFSACEVGDQSCAEAYNPNEPNDHCPYGPPGGPKLSESNEPACPLITKLDPMSADCAITFTEVYARLDAADGGNCSNGGAGCHSAKIKGIEVLNGEQQMLDGLELYKGEVGRKYFDPDAPEKSWWVCNLRGDAGKLMPTGATKKMKSEDILLVERWLACGAPQGAAPKTIAPEDVEGGTSESGAGGDTGSSSSTSE